MADPTYPAARAVAGKVRTQFAAHVEQALASGDTPVAPVPDEVAIQTMVDVAFWASLRREEGIEPRISLAFVPPDAAGQPLSFESPLPLLPAALARLAPAVERAGIHLGVWWRDDHLEVWGTTRVLPRACFVIEVVASGLLVIKQSVEAYGKFVNVAVLEGDQIKFVDEGRAFGPECPGLLKSMLGFDVAARPGRSPSVMVLLAASMRQHGRGGAMLVVPAGGSEWRESIVSPMLYGLDPPFRELADLLRQRAEDRDGYDWQESLRHAVDAVGGLTAVDGAMVISDDYEVLTFGAKITRRRGHPAVERVVTTEPIVGAATTYVTPSQLGGTRHLSAAQFVHDQREAVAFVASQDGRSTIFRWSPQEQLVHAHRVEALLL
ncbi:MAG: hypothetical protein R2752_16215 [Vicinamibacterales bacterium]